MKHAVGIAGIVVALFGLSALKGGEVAFGFPLVLVGLCSTGAVYAELEGVGLALIVIGIGVGVYVGWWQAAVLFVLGVIAAAHDPHPRTALGIALQSLGISSGARSAPHGGGGGDDC